MASALRPCRACRVLVPQLTVEPVLFERVVQALSGGSPTLAAQELVHAVPCSAKEAAAWVAHLNTCAAAWPGSPADEAVLREVAQAFATIGKPEHFTDFTHCEECREHDNTLRARTRDALRREDLGHAGWDPVNFCDGEGIGYLFPALARFALMPATWHDHGWYGAQLLFHLAHAGGDNKFFQWCSPAQRGAVSVLLSHLLATRAAAISDYGCDDDMVQALELWSVTAPTAER